MLPLLAPGTVVHFGLLTCSPEGTGSVCFPLASRRLMCRDVCEGDFRPSRGKQPNPLGWGCAGGRRVAKGHPLQCALVANRHICDVTHLWDNPGVLHT